MSDREIMNAKRGVSNPFIEKNIKKMQKLERMPDPGQHQKLSFLKSGIRIVGYLCIPFSLFAATSLLVASEVVGV